MPRDAHGAGVVVGRDHAAAQRARGGDGEHARAGAEIENTRRRLAAAKRFAQPVQRQETAARGAVMAGAEGERRLDLDADAVERNAAAVVRAVHRKTAGRDRLKPGEACADPILHGDTLEAQRLSSRRPQHGRDQVAYLVPVEFSAGVERQAPRSAAVIHKVNDNADTAAVLVNEACNHTR